MAATFSFLEANGVGMTITGSIANINFGSNDSAELTPSTYPVTANTNSYEKWVAGSFGGTFTKLDNFQFWKSAGAYVTGETIKWSGSETVYVQPVNTTSTIADTAVPTADPGTQNVSAGSDIAGSITAAGNRTDWIVMQLQTTSSTPAGAVNTKTFTFQYDEQ